MKRITQTHCAGISFTILKLIEACWQVLPVSFIAAPVFLDTILW
jgi:hypothetical protein